MNIAEQCHVVNATPPIDINGAGATSDYFSLKNYRHASIICTLGVTGASTTITVEESDDSSGSATTAIDFDYYKEETSAGDTLSDRTAVGDTTGIDASTEDSITYVIEIDADQLTDGYPYLVVKASDPSAATLYSCVAILSEPRYAQENTISAIT
jgi:hypothetical protein